MLVLLSGVSLYSEDLTLTALSLGTLFWRHMALRIALRCSSESVKEKRQWLARGELEAAWGQTRPEAL